MHWATEWWCCVLYVCVCVCVCVYVSVRWCIYVGIFHEPVWTARRTTFKEALTLMCLAFQGLHFCLSVYSPQVRVGSVSFFMQWCLFHTHQGDAMQKVQCHCQESKVIMLAKDGECICRIPEQQRVISVPSTRKHCPLDESFSFYILLNIRKVSLWKSKYM